MLPDGKFLFKRRRWILQQYNDPTHGVALDVIQEWNKDHKGCVQLLKGWLACSPDLNIIENFWAYIEARANAQGCKSLEEFKSCITTLISSRSPTMLGYLGRLFDSMPRRVQKVIEMRGKRTSY